MSVGADHWFRGWASLLLPPPNRLRGTPGRAIIPRMSITIKSPQDIEKMRVAGRLAAEVLQVVAPHVKPGATLGDIGNAIQQYAEGERFTVRMPRNIASRVVSTSRRAITDGVPA